MAVVADIYKGVFLAKVFFRLLRKKDRKMPPLPGSFASIGEAPPSVYFFKGKHLLVPITPALSGVPNSLMVPLPSIRWSSLRGRKAIQEPSDPI